MNSTITIDDTVCCQKQNCKDGITEFKDMPSYRLEISLYSLLWS